MKRNSGKFRPAPAFLAAAVLIAAVFASALPAIAAGATYYVKTASGFMTLAKKCSLDSYSRNISVELMNDIDLSGEDFSPIGIFNGDFNGNGYIISGIELTRSGSHVGLFRYVGESGRVHDLNVRGNVTPSGTAEYVGGIVGANMGTVENCSFYGSVSGLNNVGGIAGSNEPGGTLSSCRSDGKIVCSHYTGGVTGINLGTIRGCINYCSVNTTGEDFDQTLEDYDIENLNSTKNVETYTDTGGIAGFSSGEIVGCSNYGDVGYLHVGYNVGGIAGRQSGFIFNCKNYGNVLGRKEIGGIVGQMEPYLTLLCSGNNTEKLKKEFNKFHDLVGITLNDARAASAAMTSTLDSMNEYTTGALNNLGFLGGGAADLVDQAVSPGKNPAERVDYAMNNLPSVLTSLEEASRSFGSASEAFGKVNEALDIMGQMEQGTYDETQYQLLSLTSGTGGTLSANQMNPAAGEEVIITVTPNSDPAYSLSTLTVTDSDGNFVPFTDKGEGTYSFTMPTLSGDPVRDPVNSVAKPVVVRAAFTPVPGGSSKVILESGCGGTISVSDTNPYLNTEVTIYVSPDRGYRLESLYAADSEGGLELTKTDNQGSQFRFKYPGEPVHVGAVFTPMDNWAVVRDSSELIKAKTPELKASLDSASVNADKIKEILGFEYDSASGTWKLNGTPDEKQIKEAAEYAVLMAGDLTSAAGSAADIIGAATTAGSVLAPYVSGAAKTANENMSSALTDMQNASNSLTDALGASKQVIDYLNGLPDISFAGLGSEFRSNMDQLLKNMKGVTGAMSQLNKDLAAASARLTNDLSAVNDQFNVVMLLLVDTLDNLMNAQYGDAYEDISNSDTEENKNGKVAACSNSGDISGDINIGGTAGAMEIEYDFDPESDVTGMAGNNSYAKTLRSTYESICVIRDCENRGDVWSRKDCCGCIAGYMDMGSLIGCRAYGTATSQNGNYVGGLAGRSLSYVRDSYAMCTLSGGDYVGGAVGCGVYVKNCVTYVEITNSVEFTGAVAGCIETGGTASGNYFVSDELSGIDSISYVGVAEPMTYEAMCADKKIPSDFSSLFISFVSDGQIIKTIPFKYGDSLDRKDIPPVPEKDGFYGKWKDDDFEKMTFSRSVEAEYISLNTSLASRQTRKDGEVPILLAEGQFHPGSSVSVDKGGGAPELPGVLKLIESFDVTILDPEGLPAQTHTIHYLMPEKTDEDSLRIFVRDGDSWREADFETDGSYAKFEATGDEFEFCSASEGGSSALFLILGGAGLLVLLAAVYLITRAAGKKNGKGPGPGAGGGGHPEENDAEEAPESPTDEAPESGAEEPGAEDFLLTLDLFSDFDETAI